MRTFLRRARGSTAHGASVLAILFLLPSCSNEVSVTGSSASGAGGSTGSSATSSGSGAGGATGWTTLIDGTWSLPPATEGYWCTLKTIQEDTYIKAFRAQAPLGTHHTLLLRTPGGQPDGESACGPTLGADMLHASGVGSDDLTFPPGVAVKVPAGTQLMLNLHLFNTTASQLSGVSATLVQTMKASDVKQEAEMVLAGSTKISIPPNGSQAVQANCGVESTATISTIWPHMHMYGTHMKVTYQGASGTKVLQDAPYSFSDQKNYPITPVTVALGETIQIDCDYQNPTSQTIYWGDSSKSEMCFAGLYLYPAPNGIKCQ